MLPELFQKAIPILTKLEEHGYEAYFVGGCVRDFLLHRTISDMDIATNATPQEIKAIFNRTVDVGIEHGTVMVLYAQCTYEITTFRTESTYQDFRRPDKVEFVRNLPEDLKRRDFTINAMAMDKSGKIFDFHQGEYHLQQKVVQAVGDAAERFFEDALRMMRAVRFAAQLGFEISLDTQQGILCNKQLLEKIAIERIVIELEKMFSARHRNVGLSYLMTTQLYEHIPFLKENRHSLMQIQSTPCIYSESFVNYAILLYYAQVKSEDSHKILRSLKLSNQLLKEVACVLHVLQFRKESAWTNERLFSVPEYLALAGERLAKDLKLIDAVENISLLYKQLPIKSVKELALNGQRIMTLLNKKQGGAYLGEIIEDIRYKVVNGLLKNDVEQLSCYIVNRYGVNHDI